MKLPFIFYWFLFAWVGVFAIGDIPDRDLERTKSYDAR